MSEAVRTTVDFSTLRQIGWQPPGPNLIVAVVLRRLGHAPWNVCAVLNAAAKRSVQAAARRSTEAGAPTAARHAFAKLRRPGAGAAKPLPKACRWRRQSNGLARASLRVASVTA